ncbi:PAS domain S-box protein [Natronomonas salina]|uniref:PAS domain-containing sensor histidine kinase n=1 Tax=Natronomonas salina TaxID=1710540 RepID=UPI0015B3B625|nr:PAS domain S-box protein [Natronomonas salina]QLD90880.1 PAS domain S-box protein [Natronomonas salina]
MGSPGTAPDGATEEVRRHFARSDDPSAPRTAAEVAADLGCSLDVAQDSLTDLAERGALRSKEVAAGTRVWWQPADATTGATAEREEFDAFVSAVQDYAIFKLDPDGRVASWNAGARRIKGYEEAEIVGEHFSTFYTDDDRAADVPETNLETAAAKGRVVDEGWRVRRDGTRFWANVTITAVRGDDGALRGFTKVTRDMTEQREYEERLRQERDLNRQVLETVPVSIGVLTDEGGFVRANQQMLDRHGIDDSDLPGYGIDSLDVYDGDGDPIPTSEWPLTRVVETGEPVRGFQCQVEFPGGDRQWVSINAAPLEDGQQDGDRVVAAIEDVSDQKARERQLRRERDQTEQLLRTAPVAIAVHDADGETIMANRRAGESLGLTEEEIVEEPENPDEWTVYDADGEEIPDERLPTARAVATGEAVFDEEVVIERPSGDRIHFTINSAPLFGPDGDLERVITAGKDITELKHRERQLERRKAELETELSEILDRVSDAFYALDDEWRFTHLNDQAVELLGQPREELLDRTIWSVFPQATDSIYHEQFQWAMETQAPADFEVFVDNLDAWLEFNLYPSESGLSVYLQDITERKEYERKLEESNERLEQFAYAASHDLQEPLRMVSSYLQLIERRYADELDADGADFIEYAVDGADRMREMIEALLQYSRVETQGDAFEPADLEAVLSEARENLHLQIEESDADVTVGRLPTVSGDASQLRQVFQNLLDNAIEYSGEAPLQVHVDAERSGEEWVVSVSDEGIGIEPDQHERVFEVFQRLHSRDEHEGTGIGLALCERIVERHGGDIWVDSDPGEGTTFSFTLPATDGIDS